METKVIAKEPGRYIGWPTVCRRRNGELLVVFSGDRDEHVCPWGKVQLVRSGDDGKTWTDPVSICNYPLDDRDAGIIETEKGTLVVNWFTSLAFESYAKRGAKTGNAVYQQWLRHAEKLTPKIRNQWLGFWTRRSEDGGKTWLEPVRHLGTTPHGPIELKDGRLLMVGRRGGENGIEMVVEQSTDDARSWQELAVIKQDPEDDPTQYYEPHLVEAADGTLVAMFRFHYHPGKKQKRDLNGCFLRQAESHDGGKTWTTAHPTPLLGYPPHLIRLKDDRLLCVWGRRVPPYGEYACLSNDNGKTWDVDNQVRLAAAMNGDLGYPASTELPDGRILTVYYQVDKAGEKTCLMGTLWRPAPKR
jgi:Neuraminidase (sialidase)